MINRKLPNQPNDTKQFTQMRNRGIYYNHLTKYSKWMIFEIQAMLFWRVIDNKKIETFTTFIMFVKSCTKD